MPAIIEDEVYRKRTRTISIDDLHRELWREIRRERLLADPQGEPATFSGFVRQQIREVYDREVGLTQS